MWVDVLLLANLVDRPSHGYELRRRVEESSGFALSNNSLYPALRRFFEAGAVLKSAEPQEGRPPRHVYTLTDVGRELLHDMLADLPDELAGDDAEFLSRLGHFGWLAPSERLSVLDARRRALEQRERRLTALSRGQRADGWGRLALDEVVHRIHRELEWLATVRLRAADGTGAPAAGTGRGQGSGTATGSGSATGSGTGAGEAEGAGKRGRAEGLRPGEPVTSPGTSL